MARPSLQPGSWELLPFRFHHFDDESTLLTNLVGEHVFVPTDTLPKIVDGTCTDQRLLAQLRAKHIVRGLGEQAPLELLASKLGTRLARLPNSTGLHIFVLTLRCEHTCRYCQVSRRSTARDQYDMSRRTADQALDVVFRSPNPRIKIEFQGGEPLLNFEVLQYVVEQARCRNEQEGRDLSFVVTTNLALITDEILEYLRAEDIYVSTSLDGPQDLHNGNRRRPGSDSWQRTVAGIEAVRRVLGPEKLSALMTTTSTSLERVEEIIDTYVALGLAAVFLRPISPYGFARRARGGAGYDVDAWLEFYRRGFDHIVALNRSGTPMVEVYAAIIASKMLTNKDPGYVDLTSPAGMGLGALVYNYDGAVYASDEGRMLAEMGDQTFRLGQLGVDGYQEIMLKPALLDPLEQSFTQSAPMCSTCAFEPFCGADPVFHHATAGDAVGHKRFSAFCRRNTGLFTFLLGRYRDDSEVRTLLRRWASR